MYNTPDNNHSVEDHTGVPPPGQEFLEVPPPTPEEHTGVPPPSQEYLGVPPPTPEEQSSLYLPILSKKRRKPLKQRSTYPPAMVVKSTLEEENTVRGGVNKTTTRYY